MTRVRLIALLLVGCTAPAASAPIPQADDGAVPEAAPLDDAACVRCHAAAARTWEQSAHRTAFTSEIFQAEWAPSHQAACVRCHAPLADDTRPEGPAAANGISCVVCHVREGAVRATHEALDAPHPIIVDASLATADACAGCHDFRFEAVRPTPYDETGMLQGTLREWHAVQERGSCQSCHMREGARVSHAFAGPRDPALLARALHVDASAQRRAGQTAVTLTLVSQAGHAVPTGDMFRQLEIEAWVEGRPRTVARTALMRRFASVDGRLRESSDDRVPAAAPTTVTFALPRASRVAWRITWLALDPALAHARWLPEEDVRRVVAEGALDVAP